MTSAQPQRCPPPAVRLVRGGAHLTVCGALVAALLASTACLGQPAAAQSPAAAPSAPAVAKPAPTRSAPIVSAKAADPASPAATPAATPKAGNQVIAAIINDDPISTYDVDQRVNLLLLTSPAIGERMQARLKDPNINEKFKQFAMARNPKSQEEVKALQAQFVANIRSQVVGELKSGQRKTALDELIDEKLKMQAAKKVSIAVNEAEVTAAIGEIAKRNDKDEKQFAAMLAGMGINISTMKDRMRAGVAWRDVVRRQFGHQISIGTRDIEKAIASAPGGKGGTLTDLALQRVTLPFAPKSDEKTKTARFAEADQLRAKFTSCQKGAAFAQTIPGAKFEDLGQKEAGTFAEPTRSVLLGTKVGTMAPPNITAGGVELYAVCARNDRSVADSKRDEAQRELQAQEFELMARKHLKDLRAEATIVYR